MSKSRYIFIPYMLLTLLLAYQASIIMFAHVHDVNGVMEVHSHPFTDSEHTHTERQMLAIAQVSEWATTEPTFVTLNDVLFPVFNTPEYEYKSCDFWDIAPHSISLRAPPFYC